MKLGGIYVSVSAKTSKLKRDLAKAEGLTRKTAVLMKQEIGRITFAKVGIAATAFAATFAYGMKKAIDAASDLQEVQGKFDVVFAKHGKQAENMAKILIKSYAMSEREAKQYMSSIQDLLVPMGMASDQALLMSNEVVKLSADLASFNNLPTAQVMLDIQSALVGNFETMKKYGVILNEHVVKQKAFEMGLYSGKGMVDANTKALVAYTLMVEDSSAAIGDQQRTMGSYANQMKQLKTHVENIAAAIGNKLLPEATAWVNQLNTMIETNPQVIEQIGEFAKNVLNLATTMGKVVGLATEFTNVWVKSWQAMGLASAGIISWTTALTDGANAVDQFNEGLSVQKFRLLELEKIMARTKKIPGFFTQKIYQEAKQEAEILREIIASRKHLDAMRAPSRSETTLADPAMSTTSVINQKGMEANAQIALMKEVAKAQAEFQESLKISAGTAKIMDQQLRRGVGKYVKENYEQRIQILADFNMQYAEMGKSRFDLEREQLDRQIEVWREAGIEKNRINQLIADKSKAISKAENAQRLSDIHSTVSMMTDGFKMISEMGGKHSKEAFAMYKGFKIIETTIATYSAAIKAYEALVGIPFIGPFIAPAAAAAAVTFGMAQVAMIKHAQPPSYDRGGISEKEGLYRTGPIREAHIPMPSGGKIPVKIEGSQKPTVNIILNNPIFQDLETQRQVMAQIASIVAAQVAPGAVVENYENDGAIRQMVRGGM